VSRRGAAVLIVLLWVVGLGLLVGRDYFRPDAERLAEAALRINPGVVYYAVFQGQTHIGFASSSIDTMPGRIISDDYLTADIQAGGSAHRATARTNVRLTRGLRVTDFDFSLETEAGPVTANGKVLGDSILQLAIASGDTPADTQRVGIKGPIFLPTLVPLTVMLGDKPKVGKSFTFSVFDPAAMAPTNVKVTIRAESLFTIDDSASFDSTAMRWVPALRDTVRAWRLASEDGRAFSGWVDGFGRIVEATQPGNLVMRRMSYELAFENWRTAKRADSAGTGRTRDDIIESTAIAANAPIDKRRISQLTVLLKNVPLGGFDLDGDRQILRNDTLTVIREDPSSLRPSFTLPSTHARYPAELRPEPLIQSKDPQIVALATRIAAGSRDPVVVAERLTRWVHDSLEKEITFGIPNALQVLKTRSGDCNEHTQLYVALARALGLPARSAAGLALVKGKFYYHAWPEVYLGRWTAVDPTFGQFPADAAHLRFTIGGLVRQADLLRLIGQLDVDVLRSS
jgi:hypothetical protein